MCKRYDSHEQWVADIPLHCVAEGTPYSWQADKHASPEESSKQQCTTCRLAATVLADLWMRDSRCVMVLQARRRSSTAGWLVRERRCLNHGRCRLLLACCGHYISWMQTMQRCCPMRACERVE